MLLAAGCDQRLPSLSLNGARTEIEPKPTVHGAREGSPADASDAEQARVALSAQFGYELARLRRRLEQRFDKPDTLVEKPCPDPKLKPENMGDLPLALEARDSRTEPTALVPFKILESLRDDALHRIETVSLEATPRGDGLRLVRSLKSGHDGLQLLRSLSAQRYLGVFHVLHYKPPELAYNARKNRREWTVGNIVAWLVIHDLNTGDALCQTGLRAQTSLETGKYSAQRREQMRRGFERDLVNMLRKGSVLALPRITHRFSLPKSFLANQDG